MNRVFMAPENGDGGGGGGGGEPAKIGDVVDQTTVDDKTTTDDKTGDDKTGDDKTGDDKSSTDSKSEKKEAEGGESDGPKDDPLRGVPEAGFTDVTLPDGFSASESDTERLRAVGDILGLSQDGLQEVADMVVGWEADKAQQAIATQTQQYNDDIEACQADKEFGGEDYEKNIAALGDMINRAFGDDEQEKVDFVESLGLNQVKPALVRGFWRIKALVPDAHDSFVDGKGKTSGRKSEIVHTSDASRGAQLYENTK